MSLGNRKLTRYAEKIGNMGGGKRKEIIEREGEKMERKT